MCVCVLDDQEMIKMTTIIGDIVSRERERERVDL